MDTYGLTLSERELVNELLAGRSLQEAAANLNITRFTCRNRLAKIMTKTDTRRQSQLLQLILRSTSLRGDFIASHTVPRKANPLKPQEAAAAYDRLSFRQARGTEEMGFVGAGSGFLETNSAPSPLLSLFPFFP